MSRWLVTKIAALVVALAAPARAGEGDMMPLNRFPTEASARAYLKANPTGQYAKLAFLALVEFRLMREHPFASLISNDDTGLPFVTHLPLHLEERDGTLVLLGHCARPNPHWRYLQARPTALVTFNLGVEMGQLAVIGAAFLLLGWHCSERIWWRGRVVIPASLLIACAAVYWTVERVMG